jgi:glycerol-3-phosphate dehydrogenase
VSLDRLATEVFDVVIIGGGIIGAGTAALAARHGLNVALVERGDFASGTSSASSKLIHGGLRYLRMGDLRLVREARREVALLSGVVAPHIVRPMPFVLPIYRGGPYGKIPIWLALSVYGRIAGDPARRPRLIDSAEARLRAPSLRSDGLRAAGLYADAQTDDARLCLLNLRAAATAGAAVVNRAEVVALDTARGRVVAAQVHDAGAGATLSIRGRTFVNATGPWVDDVRRLEDPRAGTSVVLSKGSHLVVDGAGDDEAAVMIPIDRSRVSFAIPWHGMLLLGTTDAPFSGNRDEVEVTEADERQILSEASIALAGLDLREVRCRFAGLRVLPAGADTTTTRREVTVSRGSGGMLSIAGGKLTTYRRIALSVLEHLKTELGLPSIDATAHPLPGAAAPEAVAESLVRSHPALAPEAATHLARVYGSLADEVIRVAGDVPDALEPLVAGAPDLVAQVVYAYRREWACDAEDVVSRRTTLAIRGLDSPELRRRIETLAPRSPDRARR